MLALTYEHIQGPLPPPPAPASLSLLWLVTVTSKLVSYCFCPLHAVLNQQGVIPLHEASQIMTPSSQHPLRLHVTQSKIQSSVTSTVLPSLVFCYLSDLTCFSFSPLGLLCSRHPGLLALFWKWQACANRRAFALSASTAGTWIYRSLSTTWCFIFFSGHSLSEFSPHHIK